MELARKLRVAALKLRSRCGFELPLKENLSGADALRVISKTHYDVAPVEFWQEIVDKSG